MSRRPPVPVAIVLWFAVLLGSAAQATAQSQQPRLTIWIFRVSAQDEAARRGFSEWYNLLSNNLPFTVKRAAPGATFLDGLRVDGEDPQQPPTDAVLKRRWGEVGALQVLSAVSSRDADATVIDSRVFLGDLRGQLPSDSLHIRQRVVTKDFSITSDSIALVTLYALAMDSERLRRQPAIICGFLAQAHAIAADLDLRRLELETLAAAIEASLQTNACGAHQ